MVIGERKIPGEVVHVCGVCEQSWGEMKEDRRKEAEKQEGGKGGGILGIEERKIPGGEGRK